MTNDSLMQTEIQKLKTI